ncbi:MAG: hypothetical protein MMC33_008327 [Icmadophila ericetorum]|nr:hypothetical protein [Icmadophila ericetorum]
MAGKCTHKGCGKSFTDPGEDCTYHPGPPIFHEGQKGWKCCKPRVLTFDEFLVIPPCTTGKHSTVDDTPVPAPKEAPIEPDPAPVPKIKPISTINGATTTLPSRPQSRAPSPPPPTPESDTDDPSLEIPPNTTCRRRGCGISSPAKPTSSSREGEECIYHSGHPIFHEGSKGWTCCKRRVLEFDEFLRIEGCKKKAKHMYVGSGKKTKGKDEEQKVENVRHDFYQTPAAVHVSFYLKSVLQPPKSSISIPDPRTILLDLHTSDKKHYETSIPLFGLVDTEKSTWKIKGTKVEFVLEKADGASWPVLRSDERLTGEILQVGRAGRA